MRSLLNHVGMSPVYVLPAVILLVFSGWQGWTREPWHIEGEVVLGMMAESMVLAVLLMVVGRVQDIAFQHLEARQVAAAMGGDGPNTLGDVICYVGAGIYEETLFRLLLLPAISCCLTGVGFPSLVAMPVAVAASGFVFSGDGNPTPVRQQ